VGCSSTDAPAAENGAGDGSLTLQYLQTHEMAQGTHRPEVLLTADGNVLLVVVQPEGDMSQVGSTVHRAYLYDHQFNAHVD